MLLQLLVPGILPSIVLGMVRLPFALRRPDEGQEQPLLDRHDWKTNRTKPTATMCTPDSTYRKWESCADLLMLAGETFNQISGRPTITGRLPARVP